MAGLSALSAPQLSTEISPTIDNSFHLSTHCNTPRTKVENDRTLAIECLSGPCLGDMPYD